MMKCIFEKYVNLHYQVLVGNVAIYMKLRVYLGIETKLSIFSDIYYVNCFKNSTGPLSNLLSQANPSEHSLHSSPSI